MHRTARTAALMSTISLIALASNVPGLASNQRSPTPIHTATSPPSNSAGALPSHALVATIITWLSYKFGLPESAEHPVVELVPPRQLFALRYQLAGRPAPIPVADDQMGPSVGIVALFHDASRTIFLPEDWTGSTPAELSVLVHEMVHYLQARAGLKYNCPQEREQLAYAAQEQWLNLFGRNLAADFETDAFTLLLRTRCGF